MARQTRLVEIGVAFHVTARGNYQQPVFYTDTDRAEYLYLLSRHAAHEGLEILGWCLMTNHVHLLAVPTQPNALARSMQRTQSEYSQRLNRRQGDRRGHLWQSRFYSCPISGHHIWTVLRYIELNPVRAFVTELAEKSPWSSAMFHCGIQPSPPLLSLAWWEQAWNAVRWQSVLAHGPHEREIEAIRLSTRHGTPLGNPSFVADFEQAAGRTLSVRPAGRPKRSFAACS